MFRPKTLVSALAVASTLAIGASASADFITWTGAGGDQQWTNPANWDLGRLPDFGDVAFLYAGNGAAVQVFGTGRATNIYSERPLYVAGTLRFTSVELHNSIVMVGTGGLVMNAGGELNLYSGDSTFAGGHVYNLVQTAPGLIHVRPGASLSLTTNQPTGTLFNECNILNEGTVHHLAGTLYVQLYTESRVITNNGTWLSTAGTRITSTGIQGTALFIDNNLNWSFSGSSPLPTVVSDNDQTYFINNSNAFTDHVAVRIDRTVDIDNANRLIRGSWQCLGGQFNFNRDIRGIGPGVFVSLDGPDAGMAGLSRLEDLQGHLYLNSGAVLNVAPYFLGALTNRGQLTIGPGTQLNISGTYLQNGAGLLVHEIDNTASPASIGRIQTLLSSSVGGSLIASFFTDQIPGGAEFNMIQMMDAACCGITGSFSNVQVFGSGGTPLALRYETNRVVLAASCDAGVYGPGMPIADVSTQSTTLDVSESFSINDLDIGIDLSHTYLADLIISVEHNGVTAVLWSRQCGGNDDMGVVFNDEGAPAVCAEPTTGVVIPFEALSAFDGMDVHGTWTLTVADVAGGDSGAVSSWSLLSGGFPNPCGNPPHGACCLDRCTCESMSQADCLQNGGVYQGDGSECGGDGQCFANPACPCDVNGADGLDSQDFFDFLDLFFSSAPAADINCADGVDSQDYFDFIECFFGGC